MKVTVRVTYNLTALNLCPSVCSLVCPSVRLSVRPYVRLSVLPSVRRFVRPAVHPSDKITFRHEGPYPSAEARKKPPMGG